MKKVYIVSILIMIFILYSCSNKNLKSSDLKQSTIVVDYSNINATIKQDTIKSLKENITLVLKNKTEYDYFYGTDFNLEVELENNWYNVPFDKNPEFKEIGLVLKGNSESKEEIELSKYFSNLPDGKYRITKSFYFDGAKTVVEGSFNIK